MKYKSALEKSMHSFDSSHESEKVIVNQVSVDISDAISITKMLENRPYKNIYEIRNNLNLPNFEQYIPNNIDVKNKPPKSYDIWPVPEKIKIILLPKFRGIFSLFNNVFANSYKDEVNTINYLNVKIEEIIEKIENRNMVVKNLHENAFLSYKKAEDSQSILRNEYLTKLNLMKNEYIEDYNKELEQIKNLVTGLEDKSEDGLIKRITSAYDKLILMLPEEEK